MAHPMPMLAATASTVYAATEDGKVYSLAATGSAGATTLNWTADLHANASCPGNSCKDIRTGVTAAVLMDDNLSPTNIYVVQRSGVRGPPSGRLHTPRSTR